MPDGLKPSVTCFPIVIFKKVPVLDGGNIVGIINASNITKYAFRRLGSL